MAQILTTPTLSTVIVNYDCTNTLIQFKMQACALYYCCHSPFLSQVGAWVYRRKDRATDALNATRFIISMTSNFIQTSTWCCSLVCPKSSGNPWNYKWRPKKRVQMVENALKVCSFAILAMVICHTCTQTHTLAGHEPLVICHPDIDFVIGTYFHYGLKYWWWWCSCSWQAIGKDYLNLSFNKAKNLFLLTHFSSP